MALTATAAPQGAKRATDVVPFTDDYTAMAWYQMASVVPAEYRTMFAAFDFDGFTYTSYAGVYSGTGVATAVLELSSGDGTSQNGSAAALALSAWTHLAYVRSGTNHKLYVNGVLHDNLTYALSARLGLVGLSAGDGVKRDSAVVAPASDYTAAFWYRMSDVVTGYRTVFATIHDVAGAYDHYAGIYSEVGANSLKLYLDVRDSIGVTTGGDITLAGGRWYHIAYVRSGTNHRFYVDGVLQYTILRSPTVATPLYDTVRLGFDEYSTDNFSGWAQFREWTTALTASELAAEAASETAVKTSSLWTDTPLKTGYLDSSVYGHHWTPSGSPGFSALEVRIGSDQFSVDTGASWREFREWHAALSAAEVLSELQHTSAQRLAQLKTDTPLDTDLLDDSASGHDWTAIGSPTLASASAPSNTSAATAKEIFPDQFPFDETVDAHASGITYEIWYKFTATANAVIGGWGYGDLSIYMPYAEVLITNGTVMWQVDQADGVDNNKRFEFSVLAGETYWIVFRPNSTTASPAILTVNFQKAPAVGYVTGNIFVPPDANQTTQSGTVFAVGGNYAVQQFIYPFPAAESGDALSDGTQLWMNDDISNNLDLRNPDFTLKKHVSFTRRHGGNWPPIRTNMATQVFFAGDDATNGSQIRVEKIDRNGNSLATWTIPTTTAVAAMASSNDETILYYDDYDGTGIAIQRWDLVANAALTDLATHRPLVSGIGYGIRDILVLGDGSILASYQRGGPGALRAGDVTRYDPSGAVLNTYPVANFYSDLRLAYDPFDQSTFWYWAHVSGPGPATHGTSVFRHVRADDGTILSETRQGHFSFGSSYGDDALNPAAAFGLDPTCPFIVLRNVNVSTPNPPGSSPPGESPPLPPSPQPCECPPEEPPPDDNPPDEEIPDVIVLGAVYEPPSYPGTGTCAGGGEVVVGVNPQPGVDLCGAEVPVAYMDLTPPSSALRRYSAAAINQTVPDEPSVLSFGTVIRSLVDRAGELRGSQVDTLVADMDLALRGLESTDSLMNALVEIYLSTEAAIKAGGTGANLARRVYSGTVYDTEPLDGLTMRLRSSDFLQSLLDLDPPREYPQARFTLELFPNMGNDQTDPVSPGNPGMLGKAIPIGYGELSDDTDPNPQGVVPGIFTGVRDVGGTLLDEYVVFCHAPAAYHSLVIPVQPGHPRFRIDLSTGTGPWYFPGTAFWNANFGTANYRDITGTDGKVQRLTVFYAHGPGSVLARTGQLPVIWNGCGIEEVGNGTGRMIDSLARQVLHLLINFVTQDYRTGNWLPHLTVSAAAPYARVRSTSFEACKTRSEARVAGGHIGAWVLGNAGATQQLPALAQRFHNHGIDLGINKDGQIIGSMLDPTASGVRTVSDVTDVTDGTFRAVRRREAVKNQITGFYAHRYSEPQNFGTPIAGTQMVPFPGQEDWVFKLVEASGVASLGRYGLRTLSLECDMTRDRATAEDLRDLHLGLFEDGPIEPAYAEMLCGTNVDLGDNMRLDHFEGITASGYHHRLLRCEQHALDVDAMTVAIESLDLEQLP